MKYTFGKTFFETFMSMLPSVLKILYSDADCLLQYLDAIRYFAVDTVVIKSKRAQFFRSTM